MTGREPHPDVAARLAVEAQLDDPSNVVHLTDRTAARAWDHALEEALKRDMIDEDALAELVHGNPYRSTDPRVRTVVAVLEEEGGSPGSSLHSWRCEHPDRYGPCDCLTDVAQVIVDALDNRR